MPTTTRGDYFEWQIELPAGTWSGLIGTTQRVEGWLAHKYDLTASLPVGHPYKNTPP